MTSEEDPTDEFQMHLRFTVAQPRPSDVGSRFGSSTPHCGYLAPPKIGGGSSEDRGSQLPVKQGHPATEHAPHQTATRGGSQLVPPGIEPARRRKKGRADLTVRIPSRIQEAGHVTLTGRAKKLCTLLDLCVSSLRRGHANLLCIVPILTDDLRRGSNR